MSAITRSATSNCWNMSVRILPARKISPVVLPAISSAVSAGSINSASTRSKLIPCFVPNGRMMNARIAITSCKTAEVRQIHPLARFCPDREQVIHVIDGIELLNVLGAQLPKAHTVESLAAQVGVVTGIQKFPVKILREGLV